MCEESSKVITFIDLAGHEKYLKTTGWSLQLIAKDESNQGYTMFLQIGSEMDGGDIKKIIRKIQPFLILPDFIL